MAVAPGKVRLLLLLLLPQWLPLPVAAMPRCSFPRAVPVCEPHTHVRSRHSSQSDQHAEWMKRSAGERGMRCRSNRCNELCSKANSNNGSSKRHRLPCRLSPLQPRAAPTQPFPPFPSPSILQTCNALIPTPTWPPWHTSSANDVACTQRCFGVHHRTLTCLSRGRQGLLRPLGALERTNHTCTCKHRLPLPRRPVLP